MPTTDIDISQFWKNTEIYKRASWLYIAGRIDAQLEYFEGTPYLDECTVTLPYPAMRSLIDGIKQFVVKEGA